MKEICKVYKPEILTCPICNSKLTYCYTVSNKLVYFTSGKRMRIKNLGYKCNNCSSDTTYVSQTANKLCFKGYSYSVKVVATIALMKEEGRSRDYICDYLYNKGIEVSDRNIGNLCLKFNEFLNMDYINNINEAYKEMNEKYNQIRLSIDFMKVMDEIIIVVYDYFSTNVLALKRFKADKLEDIKNFFMEFINKDLNLTVVSTIRKDQTYQPILRELCPKNTKFIPYIKF